MVHWHTVGLRLVCVLSGKLTDEYMVRPISHDKCLLHFGPVVLGGRALDLTECECRRRPQDEGMRGRRWDCAVAMEGRDRLHVVIVGWIIRCEEFSLGRTSDGFCPLAPGIQEEGSLSGLGLPRVRRSRHLFRARRTSFSSD
jgi:hypothetical protein